MAIKKISKIKASIFKNPMYLIIGLLLVIIIILLINNYYINSKRKNVMERFSNTNSCDSTIGYQTIDNHCTCVIEDKNRKNKYDKFEPSESNCNNINNSNSRTRCQEELCGKFNQKNTTTTIQNTKDPCTLDGISKDGKCICLKTENSNEPFNSSDCPIEIYDSNLTGCQKEICKNQNQN